jgi:hypothetical protein
MPKQTIITVCTSAEPRGSTLSPLMGSTSEAKGCRRTTHRQRSGSASLQSREIRKAQIFLGMSRRLAVRRAARELVRLATPIFSPSGRHRKLERTATTPFSRYFCRCLGGDFRQAYLPLITLSRRCCGVLSCCLVNSVTCFWLRNETYRRAAGAFRSGKTAQKRRVRIGGKTA